MSFSISQPVLHRRVLLLAWTLLAAIPVGYIAAHVVASSRNIVFWDEFDTALDLILRIHAGADWRELLQRFFAINNEHRTVTSRLMFAGSYWLTGTVNFHVIGAIGNLFLVGACAILVAAVSGWERRVRMGVVLAFLMFQLEHFENFIWSGASIDHFQVVMLGVGAIAALVAAGVPAATPKTWSFRFLLAIALAVLATFTLAHGTFVWPIGAVLLLHQRRWNQLAGWCACAVGAAAAFLQGFEFNPGHNITALSIQTIGQVGRYWLALLGAPLALGNATFAPLPGFVLLGGLGFLAARGAVEREPAAFFSALFAIGALGMIAVGRYEIATSDINSRYMVLGALAWAMFLFLLLELDAGSLHAEDARSARPHPESKRPERPFRMLVCLLPALAAFNVSANVKFAPMVDTFVEVRDRAATSFKHFGEDGRGVTRLHPLDGHAAVLLKMAEESGVYRLPRFSHAAEFPDARPNPNIITYLDELLVNDRAVTIGGWAMRPGHASKCARVYVVLQSEKSRLYFSSVRLQRSDVAQAYKEPKWMYSGFRTVIARKRLPAEDFDVGVLIADGDTAEFFITPNRLLLSSPADAKAVRPTGTP